MRLAPRAEGVGRARVLERAAGLVVGQHDPALGVQDLRRLRHEADTGEGDDVGLALLRAARELERVPHEVREVLDFLFLVVMGQEDGIVLSLESADLFRARSSVGSTDARSGGAGWTAAASGKSRQAVGSGELMVRSRIVTRQAAEALRIGSLDWLASSVGFLLMRPLGSRWHASRTAFLFTFFLLAVLVLEVSGMQLIGFQFLR